MYHAPWLVSFSNREYWEHAQCFLVSGSGDFVYSGIIPVVGLYCLDIVALVIHNLARPSMHAVTEMYKY